MPSYSDSLPDEQFYFKVGVPGPEYIGYSSSNSFELRMATSSYIQIKYQQVPEAERLRAIDKIYECGQPQSKCTSIKDMSAQGLTGEYLALLGPCNSEIRVNCIDSLTATKPDGTVLTGIPKEDFRSYNPQKYIGDLNYDLPTGSSSITYEISGLPHQGGNRYLVVAQLDGRKSPQEEKFSSPNLQLGIFAVAFKNGSFNPNQTSPTDLTIPEGWDSKLSIGRSHPHLETCVQQSKTQCAVPYSLPLDTTFTLSIRLSSKINGWLHGRVSDATAEFNTSPDGSTVFKVSAKPVIVPMVGMFAKKSELTPALNAFYTAAPKPLGGTGVCQDFNETPNCLRPQVDFGETGMNEFLLWLKMMKETAISAPSQWTIRTITSGRDYRPYCYDNNSGVSGIVMTNATNYIAGAPQFNVSTQSLDYRVAAPHFLPNGEVFKGTYDLLIASQVARCLYDFSNAPIQATVSVLSADGTEQSSTTTVNEKNGWLHLAAQGFTFSNPTLRVKLTQPSGAKSENSATSSEQSSSVIKQVTKTSQKTITCKKGKALKKVAGTSPKCPKGYTKLG